MLRCCCSLPIDSSPVLYSLYSSFSYARHYSMFPMAFQTIRCLFNCSNRRGLPYHTQLRYHHGITIAGRKAHEFWLRRIWKKNAKPSGQKTKYILICSKKIFWLPVYRKRQSVDMSEMRLSTSILSFCMRNQNRWKKVQNAQALFWGIFLSESVCGQHRQVSEVLPQAWRSFTDACWNMDTSISNPTMICVITSKKTWKTGRRIVRCTMIRMRQIRSWCFKDKAVDRHTSYPVS